MKDKNGFLFEVGDIIRRYSDGVRCTLGAIRPILDGDNISPIAGGDGAREIIGLAEQTHRWEIICRADGSDPRQNGTETLLREECAQNGILSAHWESVFAVALRHLHKPLPKQPHELYAEFHRIVVETVKREAPKVSVVTDFSGPIGLISLRLGAASATLNPAMMSYVEDHVMVGLRRLRAQLDPTK